MEKKIFFIFSFLTLILFFVLGVFTFVDRNVDADLLEASIMRFLK